jgi:protease-4
VSGLLDKLGITIDTYKTAPRADAESLYRGFTPDEERELQHKIEQFYDTFLDRVSEGRGMPKDQVDAIGRGRVWTGQQAFQRGLVDRIGGLRDALDAARAAAHLPADAPITEFPQESETLVDLVLKAASVQSPERGAAAVLPPVLVGLARALAPFLVYRADEPLARLEWVEAGDGASLGLGAP